MPQNVSDAKRENISFGKNQIWGTYSGRAIVNVDLKIKILHFFLNIHK